MSAFVSSLRVEWWRHGRLLLAIPLMLVALGALVLPFLGESMVRSLAPPLFLALTGSVASAVIVASRSFCLSRSERWTHRQPIGTLSLFAAKLTFLIVVILAQIVIGQVLGMALESVLVEKTRFAPLTHVPWGALLSQDLRSLFLLGALGWIALGGTLGRSGTLAMAAGALSMAAAGAITFSAGFVEPWMGLQPGDWKVILALYVATPFILSFWGHRLSARRLDGRWAATVRVVIGLLLLSAVPATWLHSRAERLQHAEHDLTLPRIVPRFTTLSEDGQRLLITLDRQIPAQAFLGNSSGYHSVLQTAELSTDSGALLRLGALGSYWAVHGFSRCSSWPIQFGVEAEEWRSGPRVPRLLTGHSLSAWNAPPTTAFSQRFKKEIRRANARAHPIWTTRDGRRAFWAGDTVVIEDAGGEPLAEFVMRGGTTKVAVLTSHSVDLIRDELVLDPWTARVHSKTALLEHLPRGAVAIPRPGKWLAQHSLDVEKLPGVPLRDRSGPRKGLPLFSTWSLFDPDDGSRTEARGIDRLERPIAVFDDGKVLVNPAAWHRNGASGEPEGRVRLVDPGSGEGRPISIDGAPSVEVVRILEASDWRRSDNPYLPSSWLGTTEQRQRHGDSRFFHLMTREPDRDSAGFRIAIMDHRTSSFLATPAFESGVDLLAFLEPGVLLVTTGHDVVRVRLGSQEQPEILFDAWMRRSERR